MNDSTSIAVVTGAGSGIGRAAVVALARRSATVIAVARRAEGLHETVALAAGRVMPVVADVSQPAGRCAIVAAVGKRRVNSLIHLAGVMPIQNLAEGTAQLWEQVFATHVHGRLHLSVALRTALIPNGRVLFVGSKSAAQARRGTGAYCASYAASMMLAACLRMEWAEATIRVVNALPGVVATPMMDAAIHSNPAVFPDGSDFARLQKAGKLIQPQAAGAFFCWLALEAEDAYLAEHGTIDIEDHSHHAQWLKGESLYS